MRRGTAILPFAIACLHCSVSPDVQATADDLNETAASGRDWTVHPAIVELDTPHEIYAVSDPHGEYEIFSNLLAANHLIDATNADPTKVRWTGGAAVLVVNGDMIDKGPKSLQVLDLVRTLEANAPQSGGWVIATMGNHEAEFMLDPENDKATSTGEDIDGIANELVAAHIDPASLAKGTDREGRGKWIANLPFGVRIRKWFFSHSGNSQQLSVKDLASKLERSLDHHGFGDKDITGKDSILEAEDWYGNPDKKGAGKKEADALGVDHIVFGHDPSAFGEHGSVLASANGILIKIDTAMGIHTAGKAGKAFLLHVDTHGHDSAEILDEHGDATPLL